MPNELQRSRPDCHLPPLVVHHDLLADLVAKCCGKRTSKRICATPSRKRNDEHNGFGRPSVLCPSGQCCQARHSPCQLEKLSSLKLMVHECLLLSTASMWRLFSPKRQGMQRVSSLRQHPGCIFNQDRRQRWRFMSCAPTKFRSAK